MACNDRECSVCYSEAGPFQQLSCGHEFCNGCIKTWYLKGTGTGCPMCRKPIYFKGFHRVRDQWDEDAWETRCGEVFGEAIDACIADAFEMASLFPRRYRREILGEIAVDLKDIERTFRSLKAEGLVAEDIEYLMLETDMYMSDRHINKCGWIDEPRKELASRYPLIGASGPVSSAARNRARADEWCTMNIVVEF